MEDLIFLVRLIEWGIFLLMKGFKLYPHSEDIEIPFNVSQCCHCMLNDFCVMAVHDFHTYINSQTRN